MFAKQARQLGLERVPSSGAQQNGSSSSLAQGPADPAGRQGSGQAGDLDSELEDMLRLTVGFRKRCGVWPGKLAGTRRNERGKGSSGALRACEPSNTSVPDSYPQEELVSDQPSTSGARARAESGSQGAAAGPLPPSLTRESEKSGGSSSIERRGAHLGAFGLRLRHLCGAQPPKCVLRRIAALPCFCQGRLRISSSSTTARGRPARNPSPPRSRSSATCPRTRTRQSLTSSARQR